MVRGLAAADSAGRPHGRGPEPPLAAGATLVQGVPAIEIIRFSEHQSADLIVLPRGARDPAHPGSSRDTCDAVIRRAEVPCLVVPEGQDRFTRLLATLDGSERGMVVLRAACDLRRLSDHGVSAIFVEPADPDFPAGNAPVRSARAEVLERRMRAHGSGCGGVRLIERQGDVVSEVVHGLSASGGDILVVGVRRGGAAGLSESTGNGRRLLAAAPCAVLTVPL